MMDNEFGRLMGREHRRRTRPESAGGPRSATQSPAFVGRVFGNPTVPATTGCFFSVRPVAVLGTESEGRPGLLAVDATASALVLVVGGRAPVAGDDLICRFVGNRWVAERLVPVATYYGYASGCGCPSVPPVLTMTVAHPPLNGGMFQSATIRSVPVPSGYRGLNLGDANGNAYLSDTSYTDRFGDSFRYIFYCRQEQFFLSRVYLESVFGSPFEDTARFSWTIGQPGNVCSPFAMSEGLVYAGGDPSTRITITG